MDKAQLDPLAEILVPAYLDTLSYSRQFKDEHGVPPTLFAKVHHLRSIVQAMVNTSDKLLLDSEYSEFGRVQVTHADTSRSYLLRSDGAVSIERAKQEVVLFDATQYLRSEVILVAYAFHEDGMDLAVGGTRQQVGSRRLEPSGKLTFVGSWPYSFGSTPPFAQGDDDAFSELGNLPDTGETAEP
jgi:hypothetical protein